MTTERDLRENTRATRELAKSVDNLAKMIREINRDLDGFEPVPPKQYAGGMTVAEAGQNIKTNLALVSVCGVCFVGRCIPGEISNDNCVCCNKSHRKS